MSVFETRVLGLIPAKGGSSRLAKKNIALLGDGAATDVYADVPGLTLNLA